MKMNSKQVIVSKVRFIIRPCHCAEGFQLLRVKSVHCSIPMTFRYCIRMPTSATPKRDDTGRSQIEHHSESCRVLQSLQNRHFPDASPEAGPYGLRMRERPPMTSHHHPFQPTSPSPLTLIFFNTSIFLPFPLFSLPPAAGKAGWNLCPDLQRRGKRLSPARPDTTGQPRGAKLP